MIDIHTHILPNCDDGSPDVNTSVEKIRSMVEEGVTDIVLTPHFMRKLYHNTADVIDERFDLLQKAVKENGIEITLHKGAEVYLDYNIVDDIKNEKFYINDTKYVLVETGMNGFPVNFLQILYDIVRNGFRPILAHPERYQDISENPYQVEDLIFRNVYMQINAGSLLGHYGSKIQETAWILLNNGFVHFVASDDHCQSEDYSLSKAFFEIKNNLDSSLAELLIRKNPQKLLNNEKIDYIYMETVPPPPPSFWDKLRKIFK
ncbi:MAG: hypothetical protein B6D62_00555 [Candidatus Cloacimonas sp. 4484_275]|nr:MAG: hypothetical protein B6D62_00555 [Candidatus Cloacimonas sp. 4484_275]RLC49884.1 MAG: capsular biosynthesis protein [Candidatus Cloacimonadota bacterium]